MQGENHCHTEESYDSEEYRTFEHYISQHLRSPLVHYQPVLSLSTKGILIYNRIFLKGPDLVTELRDSDEAIIDKVKLLATMINDSKHLVFYTGSPNKS